MHHALPPRGSFAAVLTDSGTRWEMVAREVEGFRDTLGKPVDAGIKSIVIALNALGFSTHASCEGHLQWGIAAPWVDIEPMATESHAALRKELVAIETAIEVQECHEPDAACLDELYQKRHSLAHHIARPTRFVARDLSALLAMFYRHRDMPYDATIALQVRAIGMRMQCHGTELQAIRFTTEKRTHLMGYQAEMRAFAAFLATYDGVQPHW